jgi:hypothetical protein
MFCAAPTSTESIKDVVPSADASGENAGPKSCNAKKIAPVIPIMVGVTRAMRIAIYEKSVQNEKSDVL